MRIKGEKVKDVRVLKRALSGLGEKLQTNGDRKRNAVVMTAERINKKAGIPLNIASVKVKDRVHKQGLLSITVNGDSGGKDFGPQSFNLFIKSRSEVVLISTGEPAHDALRTYSSLEPKEIATGIFHMIVNELVEKSAA